MTDEADDLLAGVQKNGLLNSGWQGDDMAMPATVRQS